MQVKIIGSVTMIVLFMLIFVVGANAQEGPAEDSYAFGTIETIVQNYIEIIEYDYDTEEEKEVRYDITEDTELYNIESMDELKRNDNIEIEYMQKGNKKIALSITKEEETEENYAENINEV